MEHTVTCHSFHREVCKDGMESKTGWRGEEWDWGAWCEMYKEPKKSYKQTNTEAG